MAGERVRAVGGGVQTQLPVAHYNNSNAPLQWWLKSLTLEAEEKSDPKRNITTIII